MVGLVGVSRGRELTSAGGMSPRHGDLCVLPCAGPAQRRGSVQCVVVTLPSPQEVPAPAGTGISLQRNPATSDQISRRTFLIKIRRQSPLDKLCVNYEASESSLFLEVCGHWPDAGHSPCAPARCQTSAEGCVG